MHDQFQTQLKIIQDEKTQLKETVARQVVNISTLKNVVRHADKKGKLADADIDSDTVSGNRLGLAGMRDLMD